MTRTMLAVCILMLAATAEAQTLDRIRETGEVRIAFRTDAPPLSFVDAEGKPAGFTPRVCLAVVQRIANALKMDLEGRFVAVDTETRFDTIEAGEADLLCGAATVTLSRRERVDFSIPVFIDGAAMLVRRGRETDLASFDGRAIGVRTATTTEAALRNSLRNVKADIRIVEYDDHREGVLAALNGKIDGYLGDQSILLYYLIAGNAADRFEVSPNTLTVEKHALALRRGDSDFRLEVDRALSHLYRTGQMQQLFREVFPGAEPGSGLRALYLLGPEVP